MQIHLWLPLLACILEISNAGQTPILPDPSPPTIYLIRHGEKPPKGPDGEDRPGLSAEGVTRSEALVNVFGADTNYNIGLIIAEHPKKTGERSRALQTVQPLATQLKLKVYTKIRRDDPLGVANLVKKYHGKGNVLICWEHAQLANITAAIGVTQYGNESGWAGDIAYPRDRFDLIWMVPHPYTEISNVMSEQVPGLDDGKSPKQPGNAARRLEVPFLAPLFVLACFSIAYVL